LIELDNHGSEAKFIGTYSTSASIRTDHPIPFSCGVYYFEVNIISKAIKGLAPVSRFLKIVTSV
jgi:hypothetical protein